MNQPFTFSIFAIYLQGFITEGGGVVEVLTRVIDK